MMAVLGRSRSSQPLSERSHAGSVTQAPLLSRARPNGVVVRSPAGVDVRRWQPAQRSRILDVMAGATARFV